jgi:hypothetical protein
MYIKVKLHFLFAHILTNMHLSITTFSWIYHDVLEIKIFRVIEILAKSLRNFTNLL